MTTVWNGTAWVTMPSAQPGSGGGGGGGDAGFGYANFTWTGSGVSAPPAGNVPLRIDSDYVVGTGIALVSGDNTNVALTEPGLHIVQAQLWDDNESGGNQQLQLSISGDYVWYHQDGADSEDGAMDRSRVVLFFLVVSQCTIGLSVSGSFGTGQLYRYTMDIVRINGAVG
jgi:hypothetical protein